MGAGQRAGQRASGVILANIITFKLRDDNFQNARAAQALHMRARDGLPLLEDETVIPNAVCSDGANAVGHRYRSKLHAAAPARCGASVRKGFLRSESTISASTDTAISAGLTAPISTPMGALMRAICSSEKPFSIRRCTRLPWVFREPSAPT